MNQKVSRDKLKNLHSGILRTHAQLIKAHDNMLKADKKITGPIAKGAMSHADIANYTKARDAAYQAHKKWLDAQLKYFAFIEKNRVVS